MLLKGVAKVGIGQAAAGGWSRHPDIQTVLGRLPQQHVELLGPVLQPPLVELLSTSATQQRQGLGARPGPGPGVRMSGVASTNTGGRGLYSNGIKWLIVPLRDVPALTERMLQLADDPAL